MKMSGERVIPAPQARVWDALNDPDVLRQSVPGCQEMVKHSPTEFSARVQAKVGPVKANFSGDVTLSDLDPPHSYRISGKGTGGVAGFAEGGADVRLEDVGGQTKLVYDVDAKVGGKLAQIGSRLIDSTARRMADDFFNRFAEVVSNGEPQPAPKPEFPSAVEPAEAPEFPSAVEPAEAPEFPSAAEPAAKPEFPSAVEPAEPAEAIAQEPVNEPVNELVKAAAAKAPAKKSPARKTAAKKTAAKKSAAKKPARKRKESEPAPEFASEPEPTPSLMPEAAVAASASPRREEPRQNAPQQQGVPSNMSGNNIWWIVVAGLAALLVILVLANV